MYKTQLYIKHTAITIPTATAITIAVRINHSAYPIISDYTKSININIMN